MSIFDSINVLFFEKPKTGISNDLVESFSPHIIARYFSFYDNSKYVEYTNETINKYTQSFSLKEDQIAFYDNMIPKLKKKRIDYIKKPKADKEVDIIIPEFYSKREWEILQKMIS